MAVEATFDVYGVKVLLDDLPKEVDVYVPDAAPLLGMCLLDGCSVCANVEKRGRVAIERKITEEPVAS